MCGNRSKFLFKGNQKVNDVKFINAGNKNCSSLSVVVKNKGILGGPHSSTFDYNHDGSKLHIYIEQCLTRTITISVDTPIQMKKLWDIYTTIERLLMLFDGRFYVVESITFAGDTGTGIVHTSYAQECLSRRLSYCKTDPAYCHSDHVFLMYDTVLSPELITKWMQLQDELDIVHQVALYNIADTGVTHDVKCANFIECLEPTAEIVGLYDTFFPSLKPGEKTTTLKMCIDAVISKYGQDIFAEEYGANKGKFLQTLVNTRNRIMHIKRSQPTDKYLSGAESILYLAKLCHLYRTVIISLLGIDYSQYQSAVVRSVRQWNSWNGVLANFTKALK